MSPAPFELDRRDPERWLAARLSPPAAVPRVAAVLGLAAELDAIRAKVREPTLFAIRLAWWREAVDEALAGGAVRKHPVCLALAAACAEAGLPAPLLHDLIDAHETDIAPEPWPDTPALEAALAQRDGSVFALAAKAADPALDTATHAALFQAAGVAWGAARLLRGLPLMASQGRSPFPADLRARAGLDLPALFAGRTSPALRAATASLAALATRARGLGPALSDAAFAPLACVAAAPLLAARVASLADPLTTAPAPAPLRTRLALLAAIARRRL